MPKLTKSVVDAAKPSLREYVLWDEHPKGFGVRVTPHGVKSYLVKYRVGHGRRARQRKLTIGRHGSPWTLEQARREAKRLLGMAAQGSDPADQRSAKRQAERFDEFVKRYMRDHATPKKKASSAAGDQDLIDRILLPALRGRLVADIDHRDIAKLHGSMSNRPYSANRCLALLSKMFSLAEAWGDRPRLSNPCFGISKFPETKRERFLTGPELRRLSETITKAEECGAHPYGIAVLRLLIMTGARKGEILSLRWSELDSDRHLITKVDSKTGRKALPISRAASAYIRQLPRRENSPWVFPAARGDGHYQGLTKVWLNIRLQAGLPDVRIHDLRHTFASIAVGGGASLPVIGRILGHTQSQTTQRYAHLADDPVRHAIEATAHTITETVLGADKDGE